MDTEKISILLVDDDPGDCRLAKLALAKSSQTMNFAIETAGSLGQALEHLKKDSFDLVLLDLALPDSRGLKTVDEVCQLYPHMPVVVLTGLADEDLAVKAIKMGASDYLVKGEYFQSLLVRTIRYSLERKRTEQKLKQQEKNLQAIFNVAPVGMLLVDENTVVTKINDAGTKVVGKSSSEMTNLQPGESFCCVHLADDPRGCGYSPHCPSCPIRNIFEQVLTSGQAVHGVECQPTFRVGQRTVRPWLELSAEPLTVEGKKCVVVAISNITDRKRAEQALNMSEANLRRAQEIAHIGSWYLDLVKNKLNWSSELYRIFGVNPDGPPLSYEKFLQIVHPDDRKHVEMAWNAALAGQPYDMEHRILIDGQIRWIREKAEVEFTEKGKAIYGTGVAQDITDRKIAEKALEDSEHRYKTLYGSSRDAIMTLAPPIWTFTAGNPATLALFACKDEQEFIFRTPQDLSPQYQPDGQLSSVKSKQMIKTAMSKGSHFFEWQHMKITGQEFPATVSLTRVEIKNQLMLQATVRDITQRKQAEESLQKKMEELERFNRMAVGRELRMIQLKKEINNLLSELGREGKYRWMATEAKTLDR